jgi:phosphoribosylformylglycinamidine synthase subunit PurQ / glutaminase
MKTAIIQFPGSNCDTDCQYAAQAICGPAELVWHKATALPAVDLVIVPGGFSYGDYLRAGAMAARSPVMAAVHAYATQGGLVLGICNGFQVLCEVGLLPGALLRNTTQTFECRQVSLRIERTDLPFTSLFADDGRRTTDDAFTVNMPIAHHDGNYFADAETLARLESNRQIVFRYAGHNPNGSVADIAGICNVQGNVLGMMPHPERVIEDVLGGCDGTPLFESLKACVHG